MKKARIVFICFICLFVLTWIYLDWIVELQSIYWLIGKFVGFSIIVFPPLIKDCRQQTATKRNMIYRLGLLAFVMGFNGYNDIKTYKRNICQDKFGLEFNPRRRSLGIPEIPPDWHIDNRRGFSVEWKGRESVIGHQYKYISIDSCALDRESDYYNLKRTNDKSPHLTISWMYEKEKNTDSISYNYNDGDSTREVSRQFADSVFDAEKIKKD